jgi:hypothetical protein
LKRRNFFKAFAALAATVVVAPSVLAKLKPEKHILSGKAIGMMQDGLRESDFDDYLNEMTKYQSGEKFMFCGQDTYERLNKLAQAQDVKNNYGISLTKINTHHGQFHILPTPYLNGTDQARFVPVGEDSPFLRLMAGIDRTKPVTRFQEAVAVIFHCVTVAWMLIVIFIAIIKPEGNDGKTN